MEHKMTADDYVESQSKELQNRGNPKKKPTMLKKQQQHFDSADYEKSRQMKQETDTLATK